MTNNNETAFRILGAATALVFGAISGVLLSPQEGLADPSDPCQWKCMYNYELGEETCDYMGIDYETMCRWDGICITEECEYHQT